MQTKPQELAETGRRAWNSFLAVHGEIDDHVAERLLCGCKLLDRAAEARRILAKDGITTSDRFGVVRAHPMVEIERISSIAGARLVAQLEAGLRRTTSPVEPPSGANADLYD